MRANDGKNRAVFLASGSLSCPSCAKSANGMVLCPGIYCEFLLVECRISVEVLFLFTCIVCMYF